MGWEKSHKQKQMESLSWQDVIPFFFYSLTYEMGEQRIMVCTGLSVLKHQARLLEGQDNG